MTVFPPKLQLRTESETHPNIIRAAIYARISSLNQKFNYSINEQIDCCQKYIEQRGWITKYLFYDECERAKTMDRTKFQLMVEKAKLGCFDVIVFWKIDRFCRSLADLVNVERTLRECGVSLSSVTEFIDTTTSVGRFNFRSVGSVAELESEIISERARLGLNGLAKAHKWPNDHPPLGFERTKSGHLKTKSMGQVAFKLNKLSILTKKGLKWTASAVRAILVNKIYVGFYNVAGVKDYVEEYRIVEDNVFEKVNALRLRYRSKNSARPEMPKDRKKVKVEKMFGTYLQLLKEAKH